MSSFVRGTCPSHIYEHPSNHSATQSLLLTPLLRGVPILHGQIGSTSWMCYGVIQFITSCLFSSATLSSTFWHLFRCTIFSCFPFLVNMRHLIIFVTQNSINILIKPNSDIINSLKLGYIYWLNCLFCIYIGLRSPPPIYNFFCP